jgi:glycosyltransferase involved in cell wall biosynthesis
MLSIITPVLNGGQFIENNIRSIKSLNIDYEHIIVDGGSIDNTLEIVSKYNHLKLIHQKETTGMYGAINQGFKEARGKYFAYVNCDDVVLKNGFELMYTTMLKDNFDLIYSDAILNYPSKNERVKFKGRLFAKYFLERGYMPFIQPSAIFTKEIFNELNGFRSEDFKLIGDLDFFQRIALSASSNIKYAPITSSEFYVYDNSFGNRNTHLHKDECKKLNSKTEYNLFNRLLFKLF